MKKCVDCKTDKQDGGCNWLDGMALDDKCPHCGGPVEWFEPAPAGKLLDAISITNSNSYSDSEK